MYLPASYSYLASVGALCLAEVLTPLTCSQKTQKAIRTPDCPQTPQSLQLSYPTLLGKLLQASHGTAECPFAHCENLYRIRPNAQHVRLFFFARLHLRAGMMRTVLHQ